MLLVDSLVVMGLATISLGTIHEADGPVQHDFWLRNSGTEAVVLTQGYTSCGCTTIHFEKGARVAAGDSACVSLRFNPRGKGGEFEEVGTLLWNDGALRLALTGTCITSEETLLRQFPVRINDSLRLSADHFDLGRMRPGETKERTVVVLHRGEPPSEGQEGAGYRREVLSVSFTPDDSTPKGLQRIVRQLVTSQQGREVRLNIALDVIVL